MLSDQLGLLIASHLGPDALSIVDLRREETRRLDLDVSPEQLAISPAGDLVAISSAQDDAVILLAPRGERALRRIDAPGAPGDLVLDRTGDLLLVASTAAAEVALIDVADPPDLGPARPAVDVLGTYDAVAFTSANAFD